MRIRREPWFVLVAAVALAPVTGCYRHTTVRSTQLDAVVEQCDRWPRQIDRVTIDQKTQIRVDGAWENLCGRQWERPSDAEIHLRRVPSRERIRGDRMTTTVAVVVIVSAALLIVGAAALVHSFNNMDLGLGGW